MDEATAYTLLFLQLLAMHCYYTFAQLFAELGVTRYESNALRNIITFAVTSNVMRYIPITFVVTSNITCYIPI